MTIWDCYTGWLYRMVIWDGYTRWLHRRTIQDGYMELLVVQHILAGQKVFLQSCEYEIVKSNEMTAGKGVT